MNDVGKTCQITAAFRAVELTNIPDPIIVDQLAAQLAGAALSTAYSDWQKLAAAQGPGKSLRVPARNRLIDDILLHTLQHLAAQHGPDHVVQVVNVGCGMDTKPWRLQLPLNVHWYDVDQPAVMELKQQLLQQAGAETTHSSSVGSSSSTHAPAAVHCSSASCEPQQAPRAPPAALPVTLQGSSSGSDGTTSLQHHLLVNRWCPVAADLAVTSLAASLAAWGFRTDCCTVWIAEALLYYLPLDSACQLLTDMRSLSGPGSKLIATCIDSALQTAHQNLDDDHYFSTSKVAWYFSMGELQEHMQPTGWCIDTEPRTTAQLAQERYGKETYVALYGGAECCFTAEPV